MNRIFIWGTRHSFTLPDGFRFSDGSEAELKSAIKVRRVFSPSILIANFFNRKPFNR